MLILFQVVTISLVLIIAFLRPQLGYKLSRAAWRVLGQIARHRRLSVTLAGLLPLTLSATVSLLVDMPQPRYHDEFSYLLAADTFARGRLTNPTHPMWVHFESFSIIHQPSYQSKQPPVQGLMLATGQVISGHPIVGVWISIGLACAAISWMLQAWVPPQWALMGGLLAALHPGLLLRWGQSYWGGLVAITGGALLFGALRRIMRRPRIFDALLMGLGLALLANTRPWEGLVVSLPVAVVLLVWMLGKNGPPFRVLIRLIVLPILVVLALASIAMAYYNFRVTGNVLLKPYLVHEATYGVMPLFFWQSLGPKPIYRHKVLHDLYMNEALTVPRSVRGVLKKMVTRVDRLWSFYLGPVLTIPLVMLPWILRNRWMRFALLTWGVLLAAFVLQTWMQPHYAAPLTGLVFAVVLQGMRHMDLWRWRDRPTGRFIVRAIPVVFVASFLLSLTHTMWIKPPKTPWSLERAGILADLKKDSKRHLVIVRYGPTYSKFSPLKEKEWVYNEADIDNARVVWAREMDPTQNIKLIEYFTDRQVWLLDVHHDGSVIKLAPDPRS
jgi:hypothetical protein